MESFLGLIAAAWGIVMALAPALQIKRMITRRSSADISLGYFALLLPGFALWIAYGWTRADWPLVVPNILAFTVTLTTIVIGLTLRRRSQPGNH
jgi:MtN3 and saliva related transmembrane protein